MPVADSGVFRATFCDSQGLSRFLRLRLAAQHHGVHLVLAAISTPLRHLLELTEALEVFQLADTVEQALCTTDTPASRGRVGSGPGSRGSRR